MNNEASARIKINDLLREAGWRFFDEGNNKANIVLENQVKLTQQRIDQYGQDFEKTTSGYIDFLLLDKRSHPIIVLEAKSEKYDPLIGKEQARKYAKAQNCRFIILSNGNLHYLWDTEFGNPEIITNFPSPESMESYSRYKPNPQALVNEVVTSGYIAATQRSDYDLDPDFHNPELRDEYLKKIGVRLLRPYQVQAIEAVQNSVRKGNKRFLFEMATGTGKTMVSAAIIKLFLRTANAHRVLFLVDRIELENQAQKSMVNYLGNDYTSMIYKENRGAWRSADILISTVQSLTSNDKYRRLFRPTDFDLVISDEAHRSIGGNARAVFEYFVGYKLGLTATPRDYLKNADPEEFSPRDFERRLLMDTYETFGCASGEPTFRYSLVDGVKENFLINPVLVDARTNITTKLLSDEGFEYNEGVATEGDTTVFGKKDYEKRLFSDKTNITLCATFMDNALRDPISGEIGKSLIFTVSQKHAAKITQILNQMADQMFPGKYKSDFALQVTSMVPGAQTHTENFTNNKLSGRENFLENYRTSKTRVCVTVGMMTTGYDCPDLLNLCLMRPILSPSEFIQIKGRGTRKHNFSDELIDLNLKEQHKNEDKDKFLLFDFFAVCEYFEEKYDYDQVLTLPASPSEESETVREEKPKEVKIDGVELVMPDPLKSMQKIEISSKGMKVDRMFFNSFEDKIKNDPRIKEAVENEDWDLVVDHINEHYINRPEEYFTIEKLRQSSGVDRDITLREIVEKTYNIIPKYKSREEILEDEFQKFIAIKKPESGVNIPILRNYFRAYMTDKKFRNIIEQKQFAKLHTNPGFSFDQFRQIDEKYRESIPQYIETYVKEKDLL